MPESLKDFLLVWVMIPRKIWGDMTWLGRLTLFPVFALVLLFAFPVFLGISYLSMKLEGWARLRGWVPTPADITRLFFKE